MFPPAAPSQNPKLTSLLSGAQDYAFDTWVGYKGTTEGKKKFDAVITYFKGLTAPLAFCDSRSLMHIISWRRREVIDEKSLDKILLEGVKPMISVLDALAETQNKNNGEIAYDVLVKLKDAYYLGYSVAQSSRNKETTVSGIRS